MGVGAYLGAGIDIATWLVEKGKDVASSEGGKSGGAGGLVATMYATLTTSVEGISFLEDPVGFVEAVVFNLIESTVYYAVGKVALTIGDLTDLFIETSTAIGASLVTPFGAVGDVIVGLLFDVEQLVSTTAAVAGPLAPVISVVLWATVTVAAVGTLYVIWEAYKLIRTAVV